MGELDELRTTVDALKQQVEEIRTENAVARETNRNMQAQVGQLQQQLGTVNDLVHQLVGGVQELSKQKHEPNVTNQNTLDNSQTHSRTSHNGAVLLLAVAAVAIAIAAIVYGRSASLTKDRIDIQPQRNSPQVTNPQPK